jgi:hypothetical protein
MTGDIEIQVEVSGTCRGDVSLETEEIMKSLPALFALSASILFAGTVQGARSVSILADAGVNVALPSFSGNVLAFSPLLMNMMTSLPLGIQDPAPPDSEKPKDQANPRVSTDVTVTHERTAWTLNPVWWAVGAVVLVAVIAIIAMASRGSSGTTIVRG